MADWLSPMSQTYEFYEVDPGTWKDKRRLTSILSATIKRDLEKATLETASIKTSEVMGECYIRIYLVVIQNGVRERFPLGTFLVQTPSVSFDGKMQTITMDAYSPLLELKDVKPELGFTILKNKNIMENAVALTKEHLRAPVVDVSGISTKISSDYTAESDESWLDYLSNLMANAKYYYSLDEMGRVLFSPSQSTASLQPRWTYTDDNSSILYPDIEDEYDLYGIPNVVEVMYTGTTATGDSYYYSKVINDDPDSPTSTVTRGREVLYRETDPSISGVPNQAYIDQYAEELLKSLNEIEHTLSYSHGYTPVRVGDCVRLNYERAGITNIKAKVVTQDIDCSSGCTVTETAVYTTNLWKE